MSTKNFFGGDVDEPEELSNADRGDDIPSLEDTLLADEAVAPVVPAPEVPAADDDERGDAPAPEPETPAEEPEAEDTKDEVTKKKDNNFVPRARMNEVLEQKRAAEQRLKDLQAQLEAKVPPTDYPFDEKETAYMDAVLEGDHQKALAIRKEIRAAELELTRSVAATQAAQAKEATKAELEFTQVVQQMESDYPVFDQSSADYNQELVDEALELHAGFMSRGYSPAAAMRKAVTYVAKVNGLDAKSAAPAPAPKRTASTVKSKLDVAASQPPVQTGVSGGEVEPDYRNLSDEDWDKLPKATIARLRGDIM